ncbi:MAG: sulfate adenylyltransferase subunit 2 [Planctomycetes bacterium]|nr:sulfate adenylyltransferase subunit 2 [Planctomycetota bacterium]MCB9869228.1 sulfate adenylyltransferase subunit 2 [Planctomycetota bacterium]
MQIRADPDHPDSDSADWLPQRPGPVFQSAARPIDPVANLPVERYQPTHLDRLEAEAIHILRETAAQFSRPVLLYSAGKDSSVLLRLAQKAFAPAPVPFPLLHVDTSFKPPELYAFRDRAVQDAGVRLVVHRNETALAAGAEPHRLGTVRCCGLLKTQALLEALAAGGFDAAIGGGRRDEERSRAKERVFSVRDSRGQWDPRRQRPEVWTLLNGQLAAGETMRVFPLSSWSELDVWRYVARESIPVVSLYFAFLTTRPDGTTVWMRYRTLGCAPCTGATESTAQSVEEIISELVRSEVSERALRAIDHDADGAMERKKQEGYF